MEGFVAYSPIAGNHLREQCYLREIAPFRATQAGLQDRPVPGMTKAMAAQWDADPFEIAPLLRHRDAQAWGQAWSQDLHPYVGPCGCRSISRTRRPPTCSGVSAGYQTRPPAAPARATFRKMRKEEKIHLASVPGSSRRALYVPARIPPSHPETLTPSPLSRPLSRPRPIPPPEESSLLNTTAPAKIKAKL